MKSLFSKSIGLTSNSYAYIHFPLLLPKPINHRLLWENKDGQHLQDQHLRWGVTGRETAVKEGWEGIKGNDLWLSCNVFFFLQNGKSKLKEWKKPVHKSGGLARHWVRFAMFSSTNTQMVILFQNPGKTSTSRNHISVFVWISFPIT